MYLLSSPDPQHERFPPFSCLFRPPQTVALSSEQQVGALRTSLRPPPHAHVRREGAVGRAAQVGGEASGESFLEAAGEGCVSNSIFEVCGPGWLFRRRKMWVKDQLLSHVDTVYLEEIADRHTKKQGWL